MIPAGVRFQVEYPTPLASIGAYLVPEALRDGPRWPELLRPILLPHA